MKKTAKRIRRRTGKKSRKGGWNWFWNPKKKSALELMDDYRKHDCVNAPVHNTTMSLEDKIKHAHKIEPCDDIEKKINQLPDQDISDKEYEEYIKFMHAANLRKYHQSKSVKVLGLISKKNAVSRDKENRFSSKPHNYTPVLASNKFARKYYSNKPLTSTIQSTKKNPSTIF
jgi:hypothetical protein